MDRSRIAVFFATGFGCVELTEAFYQSAATYGWAGTDPITFPETLSNAPASHVALFHDLRGPNVTVSSKSFAAESALLQAASLMRHGQADMAIVLAGDTLTQAVYEWYETAICSHLPVSATNLRPRRADLSPARAWWPWCWNQPAGQAARPYAALGAGRWAAGGDARAGVRQLLGGDLPDFILCAGNGAPCAPSPLTCSPRDLVGKDTTIFPAQPVAAGMGEAGALLHLLLALSRRPGPGQALLLGTSAHGGFAALRLELF
jgi:hypothetical protein